MNTQDFVKNTITADIRSKWLKKLNILHANILQTNNFKGKTGAITLDLVENKTKWGFWDPHLRRIGLNLQLLNDCEGDAIKGILTHEIAHQLVTDLRPYAELNEPAHGPTFQKMCQKLHLHPMFCGASVDIMEGNSLPPSAYRPETLDSSLNHPILEKIKKLLALSSSPEPHEAALALTMASRLMARYNLDMSEVVGAQNTGDIKHIRIALKTTKISRRVFLIASILSDHFFVETIYGFDFSPIHCDYLRYLELIGRPVNLHLAQHVYFFLVERTETLWQTNKAKLWEAGEKGIAAKNNFIENLLLGLDEKLKSAKKESDQDSKMPSSEVILANDVQLNNYIKFLYPKLGSTRSSSGSKSTPVSSKIGRQVGRNLNIYLPVNHKTDSKQETLYLGHQTKE